MHVCPHCDHEIEKDFLRCPTCLRKLKDPCAGCGRPLDPSWKLCPYCETEVGVEAPVARRARRHREPEQTIGGRPPADLG
jgi:predicted amidophosphoribosyltransferase